ncbi:MAG: glycosyltransferase [Muribaculaceae bacterium]
MKILQVGKFYPIVGGVEKVMYNLMLGLAERGVECDMLCAASSGGSRTIEVAPRARVIACRTLAKVAATMISPSLVATMRRIAANYDIVHIHHPDPAACLALMCSGYKGRVVLHWHSDIVKQRRLLKLYAPLQNWMLHRADLIVGTSPVYLAESPHLQDVRHKTRCLPIGVAPIVPDAAKAAAIRAQYPGKKIVFSLGRLVPYKGFKYLIRAAKHLGDDYVVLIGGCGMLHDDLQREIAENGVGNRVKLLGYVSDADLPNFYEACTLFCLPSVQRTEAFGIVQIEAMSCARPIVATRIPGSGVSWVNQHGKSGLNVDPRDPKGLADAIKAVTNDQTTYNRYSQGALERYRSVFTLDHMIENCLLYYDNGKCSATK